MLPVRVAVDALSAVAADPLKLPISVEIVVATAPDIPLRAAAEDAETASTTTNLLSTDVEYDATLPMPVIVLALILPVTTNPPAMLIPSPWLMIESLIWPVVSATGI